MIAEARRLGGLLLFAAIALLVAYQRPSDIFFGFGPNDHRYVEGFREDFEIDEPTFIHWTGRSATVRLPLRIDGPFDVTLRYKRHVAAAARVRFFLGDDLVEATDIGQSDFTLRELHAPNGDGGPFELRLTSSSPDPRPLGLALDWLQIRPSRRFGAVLPDFWSSITILSWVAAFYLFPRAIGMGVGVSVTSSAAAALSLAALATVNKLWPVHAANVLGLRAHLLSLALIAFYGWRRRVEGSVFRTPAARLVVFIAFAAFAFRLFALFHPDFYYPDVRTHSKFVSLIWTEGLSGLFRNYIDYQHAHLLGLQLVGDRWVAFPYPPLLYLSIYPFSLLRLPVEEWMMLIPTAWLVAEALIVYAVAIRLGVSTRAAQVAVFLHATARVLGFRLAVASYAAMFGHFWDMVAILFLVFFYDRMKSPRYLLGWAGLIAISLLSYAGSALVLGFLVPAFCLTLAVVDRPRRPETVTPVAIALWALAGALLAIGLFYWRYVPEILTHPESAATGAELVELLFTPLAALEMAAHRLNLFYGIFGFLAVAHVLYRPTRVKHPIAYALTLAALVTYLGMNVLRAGLGDTTIFQFSKDDLVILPVIVLSLGMIVDRLSHARLGRLAATALCVSWVAWGALRFSGDIRGRFIRPDYPPAASLSSNETPMQSYAVAYSTRFPPARLAR